MAYYGNQWVYGASKKWIESKNMEVTRDSSPSNYRIDVDGGVVDGYRYFLKNGGFFNTTVKKGTLFNRSSTNSAPKVKFSALP